MAERTGAGLLCEPENPQDLAAALLRLIRDRELRADLARKAYDGVRKHYTVEQMAEQTLTVFTRQRNAAAVAR
jgi:glycosyltransferase involved in cell wall biosynthesis